MPIGGFGQAEGMEDRPWTWTLIQLNDGVDEQGNALSWHDYQHTDGRLATRFGDGSCSDPDLAKFIAEERVRLGTKLKSERVSLRRRSRELLMEVLLWAAGVVHRLSIRNSRKHG